MVTIRVHGTVLEMNGDFGEIHNFPTPRVFNVNAEGFPWNLVTVVLLKIRGTYLYQTLKKFDNVHSFKYNTTT